MSTITLPNIRVSSDLTVKVRLKDSGVAIDWSTLTKIKASIYSDAQRALAGRCDVSIDAEDPTLLVCNYAANKPQYVGVNRIVVSAKYMGETKTYDKPAFTFVRWTADQEGEQITIDDPDVDVEISVEDISSSILQEAVDAAFTAADRANDAAAAAEHMVDIHTGPEGKSAYEVAVEEGYVGTEEEWLASLVGPQGAQGIQGETGEAAGFGTVSVSLQEDGGQPSATVAASGTDTAKNFAFTFNNLKGDKGDKGDQGNSGYQGAAGELEVVNNLTDGGSTAALSAEMGKTLEGEVSQLEAKVDELSAEEALDTDEEIKVTTEDGQTVLLDITPSGVDAKNLKRNGQDVLTQHQDISSLATKTELAEGLATKEDEIPELSVGDDAPASFSGSEQIWVSDDYDEEQETGEVFAKVDSEGVHAKEFKTLDGKVLTPDVLSNKKWAVLGDSFTAYTDETIPDGKYSGQNATYPYLIGNRTGINVLSFFGDGRTLAFPATPGTFVNSVTNPTRTFYYQNIPADVDYITIYLGINDSHHAPGSGGGDGEDNTGEIPIGTITDNTTATYYGAWNVVLSWLIVNRPFAHIGIIVSNGCDTAEYRTAMLAIARKYGIPFIDLNGDDRTPFMLRASNSNIPDAIKLIRIQKQAVDYDGTKTGSVNWHPNADAHRFESFFIENFLRTI